MLETGENNDILRQNGPQEKGLRIILDLFFLTQILEISPKHHPENPGF